MPLLLCYFLFVISLVSFSFFFLFKKLLGLCLVWGSLAILGEWFVCLFLLSLKKDKEIAQRTCSSANGETNKRGNKKS